ncbi:hypothetical protein B0T14DRAFT_565227 [Immersiella caudata]|uniref:Uncharacterized protein n=1 Tax=Immersiella caudata TaxID=314043 RepID=A0AA39WZ66_9PEZI|nr:hypothetical protein B0T14DRAFT_565227 [Immersiella caudata]
MSPSNSKPLRQRAAEKLHGKDANPSQLGDPISLKAETSDTSDPSPDQDMSKTAQTPPPWSGGSHEEKMLRNGHHVRGMMTDEIRQGKVPPPKKTMEGDATSLKAENVDRDPVDHDNGVPKGSKL